MVARAGARAAMAGGLAAVAAGALALRAIAPGAPALTSLAGGFVLLGLGLGVASVASTARGTARSTPPTRAWRPALLATSAQLGTAFGLAIVLPIAAARTRRSAAARGPVAGYELGFVLAAAAAIAAAVGVIAVRSRVTTRAR